MTPPGPTLSAFTLVSVVVLLGIGVFVWSTTLHPPTAGTSGTIGPYTLDSSTSTVELTFPVCSWVTIDWHVLRGGEANFTVGVGEMVPAPSCQGPPPTNESCLPVGCSVNGPQDVCFETGASGSCSFTNNYPDGYAFSVYLWTPTESLSDLQVNFTASYGPAPGYPFQAGSGHGAT